MLGYQFFYQKIDICIYWECYLFIKSIININNINEQ